MHLSSLNPASPEAASILDLWNVTMWICGSIMTIVTVALLYIVFRFRARSAAEPAQVAGNKRLEIAWTVVPLLLVLLLFVLSIRTTGAVFDHAQQIPDIIVTGHQWWWEIYYPAANAYAANEVHIPVGRDILVGVEAADVIHDFWTPQLGPKVDAIPGRRNLTWIRADQADTYRGFCAEFCGNQHAWMQFRVVAQDAGAYNGWVARQAQPAAPVSGKDDAALGSVLFRRRTCVNCHNISGYSSQQQYAPDLTHVASRKMLAGERLENTPKNLRDWLHDPNSIKPGCAMPNLKLSDEDLTQLTAYLETLK
jgi:cytochrome c oxidase subunit 2